MGFWAKSSSAEHAISASYTASFGGKGGEGNAPSTGVRFVIRCAVVTGNDTESIIPVDQVPFRFTVIDGWCLVSTIDADATWFVRTAAGDAGGTAIAEFTPSATGRVGTTDTASTISQAAVTVTPSATVGLFVDKTAANTGVGTIYLLC